MGFSLFFGFLIIRIFGIFWDFQGFGDLFLGVGIFEILGIFLVIFELLGFSAKQYNSCLRWDRREGRASHRRLGVKNVTEEEE